MSESNMDASEEETVMMLDEASSPRELIQTEQAASQENVSIPGSSKSLPKLPEKEATSKLKDTEFIQYIQRRDNLEVKLEQAEGQEAGRIKRILDVMAEMHVLEKESTSKDRMYLDLAQAAGTSKEVQEEPFYDFGGQLKRPHSPDDY